MISKKSLFLLIIPILLSATLHAQSPPLSWASPRSMALGGVTATGFNEPANMHTNPASLFEIERFTISSGIAGSVLTGNVKPDADKRWSIKERPSLAPDFKIGRASCRERV